MSEKNYRKLMCLPLLFAFSATGCVASGGMRSSPPVSSSDSVPADPDLVNIEPGFYAVANRNVPTFFINGHYWHFDNNTWFKSRTSHGGWVRDNTPPRNLARIQNPDKYYVWGNRDRNRS